MCITTIALTKMFKKNLQHSEWFGPNLDLEHTIQVCRGERVTSNLELELIYCQALLGQIWYAFIVKDCIKNKR